jgi:hypothetical protein
MLLTIVDCERCRWRPRNVVTKRTQLEKANRFSARDRGDRSRPKWGAAQSDKTNLENSMIPAAMVP